MKHVFILMLLLAPLLAAEVRGAGSVPRIRLLLAGTLDCKPDVRVAAFEQGLRDLGHVAAKTISVERKCYSTAAEMLRLLGDTVESRPDIIVVGVPAAAIAAREATRDIPIVCISCGDPLDYGLVASLARPGGNVTGLASLSAELIGKRLQLLKEVAPGAKRVAAFLNPDNPGTRANLAALELAAAALSFDIQRFDFRNVSDLANAFRSASAAGAGAVVVQDDPFSFAGRAQIAELALKYRLPVVAGVPEIAEAGALIVYGPNRIDLHRRPPASSTRSFKGAKPADLPIEQPYTFELVINLKTASALGITVPKDLLTAASRVIPK